MWRALVILLAVLPLAACGGTTSPPIATSSPLPPTTGVVASRAAAEATGVALIPTATPLIPTPTKVATPTTTVPDAATIVQRLKGAGLPIEAVTVWTADTDPNKLLGRPNQYTSKATFRDTRVPATADPSVEAGGDIEVFASDADLQVRKTYIERIMQTSPLLLQYVYASNLSLLRISRTLVPEQAAQYQAVLGAVSGNATDTRTVTPIANVTRTPVRVATASQPASTSGVVGERVAAQGFAVTLHAVQNPAPPGQFIKPKEGYRFVAIELTIENIGTQPFDAQPFDVRIKDAGNREYLVAVGSAEPPLLNSQLMPGEAVRGWVNFEVLQDVVLATTYYSPPGSASRVTFQLR